MAEKNAAMLSGLALFSAYVFISCSGNVQLESQPDIVVILAGDLAHGDIRAINGRSGIPPTLTGWLRKGIIYQCLCFSGGLYVHKVQYTYGSLQLAFSAQEWRYLGVGGPDDRERTVYSWADALAAGLSQCLPRQMAFRARMAYHRWKACQGKSVITIRPLKKGPTDRGSTITLDRRCPAFLPMLLSRTTSWW